ncbi:MAG: DNA alkylation repair protein [Acidimicrobiales bacterium]
MTTAAAIEAELRAAGNPERAEGERAYLKSDLEFAGCTTADVRRTVRRAHAGRSRADVVGLVGALWSASLFECRLATVELLTLSASDLEPGDIGLVERLIRESRTWALVDPLAINVTGTLVAGHAEVAAVLDRWVTDDDFWVRRAAMLALLRPLREGGGDPDRFFRYADRLLDEREFFIRKAIGWVLRDMSRRRPELVRDWLAPRTHRASGVTMREAVKYLAPGDRDALMAAYREKSFTPRH